MRRPKAAQSGSLQLPVFPDSSILIFFLNLLSCGLVQPP